MYSFPTPYSQFYLDRYINFITKCIGNISKHQYIESHHILPRSMGGLDTIDNIVVLSAREHYIAHWILYRAFRTPETISAFMMMSSSNRYQRRYHNSRRYELLKEEYSELQKIRMLGEGNPFYGKNHSEESKKKMSESKRGINNSWNTGLTTESSNRLKEIGENISKSVSGMRWWTDGKVEIKSHTCPNEDFIMGRLENNNFKKTDKERECIKQRMSGGVMSWWNNGYINKRQKTKPDGDDWVKGRLLSKEMYDKFCRKIQ